MTKNGYLRAVRGSSPPRLRAWRQTIATSLVAMLLAVSPSPGADSSKSQDTIIASVRPPSRPETLPAVPAAVRPGQSLKFSVNYGFINAGAAYLEMSDVKEFHCRPVLNLVARTESNKFFSGIYKVRNRIESVWDSAG